MIVDDHAVVREGLAAVIGGQRDMQVVASVGSGAEALLLCDQVKPDLVLLDVRMAGMDGLETLTALLERFPRLRVLMLSSQVGDETIFRALKGGAVGYVLKTQPSADLLEAIRRAHQGRAPLAPEVNARLAERVAYSPLSEREIEVLGRIAHGESNKEIAQTLAISESTVKNHVNSILTKLSASDRTQAVTLALQRGIIELE